MVVECIKLTFYKEWEYKKALDLIDEIYPASVDDFVEANQVKGIDGINYWEIIIDDPNTPTDIRLFLERML